MHTIFLFQFQTGAIKSDWEAKRDALGAYQFQFQTGAIKRGFASPMLWAYFYSFNSKLVRLKEIPRRTRVSVFSTVSIPNWCD